MNFKIIITKCDRKFLKCVVGIRNCGKKVMKKCGRYYKVWCDKKLLKNAIIITKWDVASSLWRTVEMEIQKKTVKIGNHANNDADNPNPRILPPPLSVLFWYGLQIILY